MHVYGLALVAFLAGVSAASGAGAEKLGEALARFPQSVLSSPDPIQFSFVDMTANRAVAKAGGSALANGHLDLAMIDALGPLTSAEIAVWEYNAGIGVDEVSYFAGTGQPPYVTSVWGLGDAETAGHLHDGLAALDFELVGEGGVLGNGEPLAVNFELRDTGNPWRDRLGRATFVGQSGSALIQSSTPEGVEPFLREQTMAADHPVVATGLAALDAVTGTGVIMQAMLISPAFGLQAGGMGPLALSGTADFDTLRAELEAGMAKAGKGIPPYFGGIIADVKGENAMLVMTLVYPDCDTASSAAELIKARWAQGMQESAAASLQSAVAAGAGGLCGVSVTVTVHDDTGGNPLSRAVIGKFMSGQFDVLRIGAAQ